MIVLLKAAGFMSVERWQFFSNSFVLFENLGPPFHHLCLQVDTEKAI